MFLYTALPSELYEVLNCAIAAISFVAWCICLRYLTTQYLAVRSISGLLRLKLAIGLTVLLTGEWPRMAWVWLARYINNTAGEPGWMGTIPWVFIPIVSSAASVAGLACIVRAITPEAWGRWGYIVALTTAALAVIVSQVFR